VRLVFAGTPLVAVPALDALLAPAMAFDHLPAKLPSVFGADSGVICQLICYSGADESA